VFFHARFESKAELLFPVPIFLPPAFSFLTPAFV
jgi:hypothetical protein